MTYLLPFFCRLCIIYCVLSIIYNFFLDIQTSMAIKCYKAKKKKEKKSNICVKKVIKTQSMAWLYIAGDFLAPLLATDSSGSNFRPCNFVLL